MLLSSHIMPLTYRQVSAHLRPNAQFIARKQRLLATAILAVAKQPLPSQALIHSVLPLHKEAVPNPASTMIAKPMAPASAWPLRIISRPSAFSSYCKMVHAASEPNSDRWQAC